MGNGILLALAMSGGGVQPGTLEALMAARQRSYEKLALFIKWLASTLVYGYYWLKQHPKVLDKTTQQPDYAIGDLNPFAVAVSNTAATDAMVAVHRGDDLAAHVITQLLARTPAVARSALRPANHSLR